MGKNVRKIVDANRDEKDEEKRKELQLDDKGISSLTDIDNNLSTLSHLTRLILAHNRLTKITQGNSRDPCIGIRKGFFIRSLNNSFSAIGDLKSLTLLNCFNNQIDELPANFHVVCTRD